MDANGQRFWLFAAEQHFPALEHTVWDAHCRVLKLASERTLPAPTDNAAALATANDAMERIPRALDVQQSLARWVEQTDEAGNVGAVVIISAHLPAEAVLLRLPTRPTDLVVGYDGVLYLALADGILMHDLRGRWSSLTVRANEFSPWRLAADASGGVWALDRSRSRLARLQGLPSVARPYAPYAHSTFRPCAENSRPPALRIVQTAALPATERSIAIATHPRGGLLVLSWATDGDARIRRLDARTETFLTRIRLIGARFAYAITWLDSEQVAVRIPGRRDAPAFAIAPGEQQPLRSPLGEIYPLGADAVEASFVHGFDDPPHYPTTQDSQPLHRLSVANLARHGTAASFATGQMHLVDSDSQQTVWHRLNAEAALPVGTAFIAWLAATSEPEPPTDSSAWCAHHFGRRGTAPIGPHEPHAAWEPMASELPGHPGLGPWERETDRAGLFSVLIQDAHHRVRALTGRYLWLRLELFGDGRASPQIAAVRAWGSRFSYRDTYLPRIYRESLYGAPAIAPGIRFAELPVGDLLAQLDAGGTAATTLLNAFSANGVVLGGVTHIRVEQAGVQWLLADRASGRSLRVRREDQALALYRPQATPADFLERFLCSFEAMLTPLEDKVAAAHLLSDPASAPEAHLDWLGAWIGVAFDSALPAERRRQWLAAAPQLARYHGTTRGLALALDIATGGGVRGGEIVLLEDFRLRRVFATLLGVDLTDEHDPLLPGLTISGNSIVGDTLILGEAETVELLALFRSEVATPEENAAVLSFYDKLAHRATVLVHQTVSPQDLGLIRRIVELESPAHVEVRVLTATWPLLVGVASLVGVDTYLGPPLLPQPARVEVSSLGLGDYVLGDAALDPRVNGAAAAPLQSRPPVANAGEDLTVPFGRSFDLDGSSSSAAPERSIERFTWRRTE